MGLERERERKQQVQIDVTCSWTSQHLRSQGSPATPAVSADPCWPSLSLHGCLSVWVTGGGPAQEKLEKACEESNRLSRYPCGCLYRSVTVWRHFISSYFRILTLKRNSFFPTWRFQAGFLPHSPTTASATSWGCGEHDAGFLLQQSLALWPTPSALEIIWFIHMLLMTGIRQRRLRRIRGSRPAFAHSTKSFLGFASVLNRLMPSFKGMGGHLVGGETAEWVKSVSACFLVATTGAWILQSSLRASHEFLLENSLGFIVGNNCDLKRLLFMS